MSLFWKILETVDYSVMRVTGRWPKPSAGPARGSSETSSAQETAVTSGRSGALASNDGVSTEIS